MPRVVFVLGLCGSGKSTRAAELACRGFVNFDEKVTGKPLHPDWQNSSYPDFIQTVATGRDCVVTEIHYYHRHARQQVTPQLTAVRPDVAIEWECFDHAEVEVADYNCEHDPDRTPEGIAANLAQNQTTLERLRNGTYELPIRHALLKTVRRPQRH